MQLRRPLAAAPCAGCAKPGMACQQHHARVGRVPQDRKALVVPGEDALRIGQQQPPGWRSAPHRERPVGLRLLRRRKASSGPRRSTGIRPRAISERAPHAAPGSLIGIDPVDDGLAHPDRDRDRPLAAEIRVLRFQIGAAGIGRSKRFRASAASGSREHGADPRGGAPSCPTTQRATACQAITAMTGV